MSHSTVGDYLHRAECAGLTWPLPDSLGEARLYDLLFPDQARPQGQPRPLPDWKCVHEQLRQKGVTRELVWREYREDHPDGYGYSRFCELYQAWSGRLRPTMRLDHPAGEVCYVDYAGKPAHYIDLATGEVLDAPVFVAVLGASDMIYAEAQLDVTTRSWIGAHVRAFEFFGGAPRLLVPDNLAVGVTNPCRYEPGVNRAYERFAAHYGVAVLPTRVRKPRDKGKVEQAVLGVERWVLAPLRNERFPSLGNLNAAMRRRLDAYLDRTMKVFGESRRELFDRLERGALTPLPPNPFEVEEWSMARVAPDYHVQVDFHFYSVPHRLIKEKVEIRLTERTVEVFHKVRRVASHCRSMKRGGHTTDPEHMPKAHREYAEWTPERLAAWAAKKGTHVEELVTRVMATRRHPQQGFRAAMGIIRLADMHGAERLDAACQRCLERHSLSYKGVKYVLERGLDQVEPTPEVPAVADGHSNVRGAGYYE